MPKKREKKKKSLKNQISQNIIQQTIPNYGADQFSGYQYNDNNAFAPHQLRESTTLFLQIILLVN